MGDARRRYRAAFAALFLTIALAMTPAPAAAHGPGPTARPEADRMRLDLSMFDGAGLSERMLARIRGEVEAVFDAVDVEVGWLDRLKHPNRRSPHPEIKVIVIDRPPAKWGLGERVMGTVLGDPPRRTVYVFYPSVLRTIKRYGYEPGPGGGTPVLGNESPDVARALARVLAHEVVHVLTPGEPHADAGLMQRRLDQHDLLAAEAMLDDSFLAAFRSGLTAAIRAQRVLMATPGSGGPSRY